MSDTAPRQQLRGPTLILAGLILAITNFIVVLDSTIANVSVPHIAGNLGVSVSQGTWIITSYSVAEAICLPLTGWLSRRFGMVKVFTAAIIGFGLFSLANGFAWSLPVLVLFRVCQGFCAGPIMALVQTLILRIFPKDRQPQALGAWAMTTTVAPIVGPIVGGWICDNWSWPWIFLVNVPIAAGCAFGAMKVLRSSETETEIVPVDRIGLALLIIWIGAFQTMLDLGRDNDWFGSTMVVILAVMALIGFLVFLVWELTDLEPIVDLRVFRNRGFSAATIAISVAYGIFFATVVIIPQWLEGSLGYTATQAGYATAFMGVLAVVMSPVVAFLTTKTDPRLLGSFGIAWFGLAALMRTQWTSGADFYSLALPQFVQGFGVAFFFIPLTSIALGGVEPREVASAAGVMTFLRTLAGAVFASIGTSLWESEARTSRTGMAGSMNDAAESLAQFQSKGMTLEQARAALSQMVDRESLSISIDHIFFMAAAAFFVASALIWLAPRPRADLDVSAVH